VHLGFKRIVFWLFIIFALSVAFLSGVFTSSVSLEPPSQLSLINHKLIYSVALRRTTPPQDPTEPWIETLSWSPRVFLYHNFLTPEECDEIISLGEKEVSRSLVVGGVGKSVESTARTSSGLFFVDTFMKQSPLLRDVERRIAEWTHLPVENGEAFYLLRYEKGQEYKPHTDFFSKTADGKNHYSNEGNRYATVLTYLHTPDAGGATIFPNANLRVPAKQGNAVLFWDLDPLNQGDYASLHGGEPVETGTKWAMTKWIRESKYWRFEDNLSDEEKLRISEEDQLFRKKKFL